MVQRGGRTRRGEAKGSYREAENTDRENRGKGKCDKRASVKK
jgi:hypothetical protein